MKQHTSKSDLTQLIASGHEKEALNKIIALAEFQNQETQQLIYLLSNRYKKLQKKLQIGNISAENAAVRSADINYELLNLIEQISFTVKEKPISKSIPEPKHDISTKVSTSLAQMIKPILFGLALLASFFFFKNKIFTSETASNQKSWLGLWEHTRIIDQGEETFGSLHFYSEGDQWIGKSDNANGSTDSLYDIHFLEEGKKLMGNWINSDFEKSIEPDAEFELRGTFTFELDANGKNLFKGKYTNSYPKSSPKYVELNWNGKKE